MALIYGDTKKTFHDKIEKGAQYYVCQRLDDYRQSYIFFL